MAQLVADRRDLDFVLYEQFKIDELSKSKKFAGMDRKMFNMIISEARNFALKEILPLSEIGDREGLKFENGKVTIPQSFHKPYEQLREGGWIAMMEDPEIGGQGLPYSVAQASMEYIMGSDFSFGAYGFATHGAAKMIEVFGTDKQKDLYMKRMYDGEFSGTMVLTESEAGSDLGALTTKAVKNEDGTYSITGNKIFITCGEHDLTENIIHPVLARIEGAPSGTKGISLFLVPKIWVNDDGTPGEANDVVCTAIEEKLGIHASPTCQLAFGGKGKCRGVLLGEENKGMKVMFHMMNEARLGVGAMGLFNGSTAYLYALDYARNRKQGRDLSKIFDKEAPSVEIINHPDIRRELLWMKSHIEGMRSLVYFVAHLFDLIECCDDENEKNKMEDLVDLLTPIVKSYCTDKGFDCCVSAMQVYGGYGYTRDYPIERLLRDSKINSIYEGTNGIQAMDLIGRKLGVKGGAPVMELFKRMEDTIKEAEKRDSISHLSKKFKKVLNKLGETSMKLGEVLMSSDMKDAFSQAKPFLDASGDIIMAWMLLWRAVIAEDKLLELKKEKDFENLKGKKGKEKAFYQGQIYSAKYYIETIIPKTYGTLISIGNFSKAVVDIPDDSFGGI